MPHLVEDESYAHSDSSQEERLRDLCETAIEDKAKCERDKDPGFHKVTYLFMRSGEHYFLAHAVVVS